MSCNPWSMQHEALSQNQRCCAWNVRFPLLCRLISLLFEVMEYTFTYLQPNFNECWWVHFPHDWLAWHGQSRSKLSSFRPRRLHVPAC